MNSAKQTNKFTRFLKNNAALLLLVFCVVSITAVVLAVSLSDKNVEKPVDATPDSPVVDNTPTITDPKPDDGPATPVIKTEKVYFNSPLAYKTVGMQYTDNKDLLFVFNQTLNSWQAHKGVDLLAEENTQVVSMYKGTVVDVGESYGMGGYVKIDHGQNVVATYASLSDVQVIKGQAVAKGEKLGVVSTTASYEFSDGAHLHLEVMQNGTAVDPMEYVEGKIYRDEVIS